MQRDDPYITWLQKVGPFMLNGPTVLSQAGCARIIGLQAPVMAKDNLKKIVLGTVLKKYGGSLTFWHVQ